MNITGSATGGRRGTKNEICLVAVNDLKKTDFAFKTKTLRLFAGNRLNPGYVFSVK